MRTSSFTMSLYVIRDGDRDIVDCHKGLLLHVSTHHWSDVIEHFLVYTTIYLIEEFQTLD